MALLHALGRVCRFVLRCKNLYRIGPKIGLSWSTAALFQQAALPQQLLKLKKINKVADLLYQSICWKIYLSYLYGIDESGAKYVFKLCVRV